MPTVIDPDTIVPVVVGPGCLRRDLPTVGGLRAWIVDMAAGAEWPFVDQHDAYGEEVYVVSGEMIDGEQRIGAGSYVLFGSGSSHRPRTEIGVRLFGVNADGGAPVTVPPA